MSSDLELKIRIRALLEGNGIAITDDQLEKLTRTTERTKRGAKEAGDAIQQFGRRGSEAKDAFEGLSTVARGGEGALFGLAKAWRALTAAFAANPITAVLALILGLLPLIQKGFDLVVSSAQKAVDRMAGSGEQVRAVAKNLKELADASEKYTKAAALDAERLAASYARVSAQIDGTLRRLKEVEAAKAGAERASIELQRATALATAKSPAAAAAINAQFDKQLADLSAASDKRIGDAELLAITQKGIEAQSSRDAAAKAISDAEARVAAARQAEQQATSPLAAGNALRARQQAEQDLAEISKRYQPQLERAIQDLKDADAAAQAFGYRESAQRSQVKTESIVRAAKQFEAAGGADRQAALRRDAQAAYERGDFAAQDIAVAELRKLNKANSELTKAIKETAAESTAALERTSSELRKTKKQLTAVKESSASNN